MYIYQSYFYTNTSFREMLIYIHLGPIRKINADIFAFQRQYSSFYFDYFCINLILKFP